MLKRALLGAVLIGLAAVALSRGGGTMPPLRAPEDPPAPPGRGAFAGLPEVAVGRSAAHAPSLEPEPAAAAPEVEAEIACGEVRGILVDPEGSPLARSAVLLRRGRGVREVRRIERTDADGMFHFSAVPAGAWEAGVLVASARGGASAAALQTVEIPADGRIWVDLWLPGARVIRGRILLDEDGLPPGMIHEVEARPLLEPERVAADAIAADESAEEFEPLPGRAELERRVLDEFRAENPGAAEPARESVAAWAEELAAELDSVRVAEGAAFALGGLAPGRYAVRIYLDVERSSWATFEADTRESDAELGLLRLRFEDFRGAGP